MVTGLEFCAPCDTVPPQLGIWSSSDTALPMRHVFGGKCNKKIFFIVFLPSFSVQRLFCALVL